MNNKFRFILFFLLVLSTEIFGAKWDLFTVCDTIPIKNGTSKRRLMKDVEDWFEKERGQGLVRKNPTTFELEGKGLFIYYNYVNVEDVFLSPRVNERTMGNITFHIKVSIQDSIVIAQYTQFTHEAYYSQYGQLSFGTLTAFESIPPGRCLESKIWCAAVWQDMKSKAEINARDRISRMIPEKYIRKKGRVFKVDVIEIEEEPEEVDPKDYLKLENYLLKDDEE